MAVLSSETLTVGRMPALIVVDATLGFTSPESPLGADMGKAVEAINTLLALFRRKKWPVVFTTNAYSHPAEASVFREKLPLLNQLVVGSDLAKIDPRIPPWDGELVLNKRVPSAFFDSPLRQLLLERQVDSVVVVGFSTSGCVRATAVDALQSNFRLFVVRDGCGDRDPEAHDANLRDISLKYGEVLALGEMVDLLEPIPGVG